MTVFRSAFVFVLLPNVLIQAATVRGVVQDPGGQPLPTAQIRALSWPERTEIAKATTDKLGAYSLEVPRGMYAIESCLSGFLCVAYYPVTLNTLDVSIFEFRLPLGPIVGDTFVEEFLISGVLRRRNLAVKGYEVCFIRGDIANPVCVLTGPGGTYKTSLPAGAYILAVASPAGTVVWRNVIELNRTTRKDIELEAK